MDLQSQNENGKCSKEGYLDKEIFPLETSN